LSLLNLFKPIKIGEIEIRNRIAMAPMGIFPSYSDRMVPDVLVPLLESRSKGGAGLIISEGFQGTRYQNVLMLGAHDDRFIPGMRKYAEAIHRYGSATFLQIMALGGKDITENYAPSSIESPQYLSRPKEFSGTQIAEIIEDFANSAWRAQQAGFDGVELHGAHSYMIGQFISPHFNRRDDKYGGDFERRMRVPTEIVRRIGKLCGKNFPVGFKFSAWEQLPNGVKHELAVRIAQRMADEGVVYVHVQTSDFYPPVPVRSKYPAMSPMYSPRNTLAELSENLKRNVRNTLVMCADGIIDPNEADALIGEGKADMVAIGRALLADPEWPNRAEQRKRIRPCIRCNVCHHKVVAVEEPIACTVNPYLARERDEPIQKTQKSKNVIVVGSGPAGITCALIASRRGHNVTLYEEKSEIGGLLVPGSTPPFKKDLRAFLDYCRGEVYDSDVKVQLNTKVTPDLVRQIKPDTLVVAVGGKPIRLNVPGGDGENVISAADALECVEKIEGERIAVVGGGEVGCETALYLSQEGNEVSMIEALDDILTVNEIKNNSVVLRELLEKERVRVYARSNVEKITPSAVNIVSRDGHRKELEADIVILAAGLKVDETCTKPLLRSCPDSFAIGDCVNPARILEAVSEGDRTGRVL